MTKITILYSELADYSAACFRALSKEADVLLFHWPINPEAPFNFDLSFCRAFNRDDESRMSMHARVKEFNPDLILCSGWMDKGYVKICKAFRSQIPTIMSMDNHWTGSAKQQLAAITSPFIIKQAFSGAFVPGSPQVKYARKLGFDCENIRTGFYTADTNKFRQYAEDLELIFAGVTRFLYLGRYVRHKGVFDLWEAFKMVKKQGVKAELWCVGTGDEYANRLEADGIRHFGFVQPGELLPILKQCHAYILPSHFEPWGVSVHEMATIGYPLLLSSAIGAKEDYLKHGENGYQFSSGNTADLADAMIKFVNCGHQKKLEMSGLSRRLAENNSPQKWSKTLLSFLS